MISVQILHTEGHFWRRLFEYLDSRGGEVSATQLPNQLPMMVDEPREFLSASVGAAGITIAVNIHHDLLAELPSLIAERGGRALVAPREDPNWIRPGLILQTSGAADKLGVECSFPEPFCSLEPVTPAIQQFCQEYQVGRTKLELVIEDGRVHEARCVCSTPCGLSQWVSERLVGVEAGEALMERAKVLHHSRPCLASMAMVPGMDDTLMHKSLFMFLDSVREALATAITAQQSAAGETPGEAR